MMRKGNIEATLTLTGITVAGITAIVGLIVLISRLISPSSSNTAYIYIVIVLAVVTIIISLVNLIHDVNAKRKKQITIKGQEKPEQELELALPYKVPFQLTSLWKEQEQELALVKGLVDQIATLGNQQRQSLATLLQQEISQATSLRALNAELEEQLSKKEKHLELEEELLRLEEKRLEVTQQRVNYALEAAKRLVDTFYPDADQNTRDTFVRTLIPQLL